jgi:Rieske Fe-S protein
VAGIPVGGAISAQLPDGTPVILSRPTAEKVVAFSAICTHMGCTVAPAGGDVIACPCHGSTFDAVTGKNLSGPAPSPLAAVAVKVVGASIVIGPVGG